MKPTSIINQDILHQIDKVPALTGIGIILNLGNDPQLLRRSNSCLAAGDYLVIDLEAENSKNDVSGAGKEAGLAAINCSAAVIAGLVTFGSGAASPFTGGSSLALRWLHKKAFYRYGRL